MYSSSSKEAFPRAGAAANDANDASECVREGVIHQFTKAGAKVCDTLSAASGKISHATDATTKQVRSTPVQSALMALCAGYIIGRITKR